MSFEGKSLTHLVSAQNGSYYKLLHTIPKELVAGWDNNHESMANYREAKSIFPSRKSHYGTEILLTSAKHKLFPGQKKTCQTIVDLFNGHFFLLKYFFKKLCNDKSKEKCHIKKSLEKTNLCNLSPF